jgi:flagellar basal-body rod modification protein FlgD
MTDVSAIQGTGQLTRATAPSETAGTPQTLGYEAFLRLLVTQMQNQDPLEPTSNTEYVAQLATFSNVEQNVITNQRLSALLTATAVGDAQSLIGRTLSDGSGTGGTVAKVTLTSDGTVATLEGGRTILVGPGVTIE